MRWTHSLPLLGLLSLLVSCSSQAPAPPGNPPRPGFAEDRAKDTAPQGGNEPKGQFADGGKEPAKLPPELEGVPADASTREKYDTAVNEALGFMAERKLDRALAALEMAKGFNDTPFIRAEIDKLRLRLDEQTAADQTVQNIQEVLEAGKAQDAAQLANQALSQYGGSQFAEPLTRLKFQADALATAELPDNNARFQQFRGQAQQALAEKNYRAAALAMEQALQYGQDPTLRQEYDRVRQTLRTYDEKRTRAAELRRDPVQIEEAIGQLKEAAQAWETLQVRQEIDEYTLALQKRRDRVAAVDFEVRGEVGIPSAGKVIAEELLPHLKRRFDLVERAQFNQVVAELKLEDQPNFEEPARQKEVAALARVRYLLLGSISQLGGLVVQARLVDVRTGLIVQSAKVVAATPDEVLQKLPELGKLLLMSDDERLAHERQQLQQPPPQPVLPPLEEAAVPPAPEAPVAEQPLPPPEVVYAPPPPRGALQVEQFDRLPPPPAQNVVIQQPVIVVEKEVVVKRRMLGIALTLGDNLFRRGKYREAHAQFELALQLAPHEREVRVRVERCQPLLPPPVVVVHSPVPLPPPPPPRPRIAILDFLESGRPTVVPPGSGSWTAAQLAPYFSPPYEIVDGGQVYWYMGRLNMTMGDLLNDPSARRWLGRALNIRYFVLGTLRETASFDATAHLLDAETGFVHGHGRVHCHSLHELKLRLGELARQTLLSPEERRRLEQDQRAFEEMLVQARQAQGRNDFVVSLRFFEQALQARPGNVEVLVGVQQCRHRQREAELALARQREFERIRAEVEAFQRRQLELARAADHARQEAARRAALMAEAERRADAERRLRLQAAAQQQLVAQARFALQTKNFSLSVQLFDSATRLRPSDNVYREMAQARAEAEQQAQQRAAQEAAAREAQRQRQRDAELARLKLEAEREAFRRRAEEFARRKAEEARDSAQYQKALDDGQRLLSQGKYDQAVTALQAARQVRKTDEVQTLLSQALVEQARATAQAQGATERRELERQLALEKERRQQAEITARRNREKYQAALELARKAMVAKKYDNAIAAYNDAGAVFKTDLVLTGLREAQAARARDEKLAQEAAAKAAQEQRRESDFQKLLTEGQAALKAQDFGKAAQAYSAAKQLKPGNVDALAGLTRAEQARSQALAEARRKEEEQQRSKSLHQFLTAGKANLTTRQYDGAILALNEALKIAPTHPEAKQLLTQAEAGRKQLALDARADAAAKKKAAAYQQMVADGRVALNLKQFDLALKKFTEAQNLLPGDSTSATLLKEAQGGKIAAEAKLLVEAKQRAEALKREQAFKTALDQARTALARQDLLAASKAVLEAAEIAPQNTDLLRVRDDLRKAQDAARTEESVRKQRQQQFEGLLQKGKTAEGAKKLDEAIKAYSDALALNPQDKGTRLLLQAAQKAQRDAQLGAQQAALAAKTKAYQDAIKAGQTALRERKYDDAVKSFQTASAAFPEDKTAAALLNQARTEQQGALKSAAAEAKKKADFDAQMTQGQKAVTAKKYSDAVKAYQAALQILPGNLEATAALQQARRLEQVGSTPTPPKTDPPKTTPTAPKTTPTPPKITPTPPAKLSYQEQLDKAADLEKKKKYAEAVAIYQELYKERPKDAKLINAWRSAQFNQHLDEGQRYLDQRKYAEAVRALEAAVRLQPTNPTAQSLLKQAKKNAR